MKKVLKIKGFESKLDKKEFWKDDEKVLCLNNMCKFNVQYLGEIEIPEYKEDYLCKEEMKKLISKKAKTGELKINSFNIIFHDATTHALILDQTLKRVVRCSTYPVVPFSFFYISKDPSSNVYQLYGFISCKEVGERIVNAIEYAMELFNERQFEIQKVKLLTDSTHEDPETVFKQSTLSEKFQDPQSSIVVPNIPIKSLKTFTDYKSIPRPKAIKPIERKASADIFPKLKQDDMFKASDTPSKSVDSTLGFSTNDNLSYFTKERKYSNDEDLSNFSSEERLQRMHHINKAFYEQKSTFPVSENIFSTFNVTCCTNNESIPNSRYDHLKNLSNQPETGWSRDLVKAEQHKPVSSNSFSNFLDEMTIPNLFNIKPLSTRTQSDDISWKQ